jgi:hypothetical protein
MKPAELAELVSEVHDRGYVRGQRQAWLGLLQTAIRELRGAGVDVEEPSLALAAAVSELEQVRSSLREACADFGDNDWPDNLNLSDVLEKHLVAYLETDE